MTLAETRLSSEREQPTSKCATELQFQAITICTRRTRRRSATKFIGGSALNDSPHAYMRDQVSAHLSQDESVGRLLEGVDLVLESSSTSLEMGSDDELAKERLGSNQQEI